ncbi:O-antigen ligase family protein [Shewanella livingstonensis]|uniref:O-antigen ligase domain-containing protein n=1 Tax=Shewanella livingstonensis TaxID=150120 RepID=A0A3G8LXL0_9GAMM|nr:O-antigen ligase family protein [Shewanella livingstonensis]AZG73835.1 O-antigen ligase domain-containing protein [Shewanella livingstonensis]
MDKMIAHTRMPFGLFNRFMLLALCALIIWMPIPLGSNRIWALAILEFCIVLLGVMHIGYCIKHNALLLRYRWQKYALIPIGLMLVYLCLQLLNWIPAIGTVDSYQTAQQLLKTFCYCVFILLLSQYCQNSQAMRWLLVAIIVSGCLQAFYGTLLNLLQLDISPIFGYHDGDRARGSFVYQNHFANYLALCLCIAFGWLLSELKTSKKEFDLRTMLIDLLSTLFSRKLILRLAIVIMVIGLILSRSRMGNAGFFTALGVVSLLSMFIYRRPPTLFKPLVVSIFILDLLIVGSIFGVDKLKQRLDDTSFASETRDEVVIDSIPIIQDHLFTGTGGGSFYTVFPQYQPQFYSGFYDHAHNDYIQFAVEYGLVVTGLLGLWVLYCLWLACRTMFLRNNKLYKGVAFGCAMAIVHMLIHCTVDFNLQSPANTLLFLTILTLCWLVRYLPADTHKIAR